MPDPTPLSPIQKLNPPQVKADTLAVNLVSTPTNITKFSPPPKISMTCVAHSQVNIPDPANQGKTIPAYQYNFSSVEGVGNVLNAMVGLVSSSPSDYVVGSTYDLILG
jgi:hypothetical protein